VSLISPEISNQYIDNDIKFVSHKDYESEDYDITHFQMANSHLHEFQLHLLENNVKQFKNSSNIITTVHDARNFDSFNLKCSKCISFGVNYSKTPFMMPYNIVDIAFQRISKYLIFHNKSALDEYKSRYKLDNKSLKCIPISAYRLAGSPPIKSDETNYTDNRLLVPGYISPFKGQDILLEAVTKIDHDLKLVFMGKIVDEKYGDYLNKFIVREGIEDKVEFLGFVSDSEFIEEIDKAKLVLVPRLISSWLKERPIYKFRKLLRLDYLISQSSSAVLTMALASGKTIVCSKNQGFSEYVNSSRGMFCDDQVESWRNAINYLIENPEQVKEMSLNSKKFANETISPAMIAKRHIKLYQKCL